MLEMTESWAPIFLFVRGSGEEKRWTFAPLLYIQKKQPWRDRVVLQTWGQMNPDVRACSQGGVHLYSSCFSLFKCSVVSLYSIFPGRLPPSSLLYSAMFSHTFSE